jgi:hypothetical protein
VIPVSDLKTALRIDTLEDAYAEEAQVAYLEDLEAAAVAWIERRTGRYFGPPLEDAEYVLPGSAAGTLRLPERAAEITSVASRSYLGGEETVIGEDDDDGWLLRLRAGGSHGTEILRRGGVFWDSALEYVVTATVGYEPSEEPPDIRQAVTYLVSHWWEHRVPVAVGTVAPEIEFTLRDLLGPWIRHGV